MVKRLGGSMPKEELIILIKRQPDNKWWDWEHGSMICTDDQEVMKLIENSLEEIKRLKGES